MAVHGRIGSVSGRGNGWTPVRRIGETLLRVNGIAPGFVDGTVPKRYYYASNFKEYTRFVRKEGAQ